MKSVVKSIRFPKTILEDVHPIMKKNNLNFTEFVIEAIKTYIRVLNYTDGIKKSFGAWENGAHPELKKGVNSYIRNMRKSRNI